MRLNVFANVRTHARTCVYNGHVRVYMCEGVCTRVCGVCLRVRVYTFECVCARIYENYTQILFKV